MTTPPQNWDDLVMDIDTQIPQPMRDLMLDLILAWAELDGAISMMVSAIYGLNPTTGSLLMGKLRANDKLEKAVRFYRAFGQDDSAKTLKKIKSGYEKRSRSRNLIAHSKCAGVLNSNQNSLIFATFETGRHGQLAVDRVTSSEIKDCVKWAKRETSRCLEIVDQSAIFDETASEKAVIYEGLASETLGLDPRELIDDIIVKGRMRRDAA